MAISLKLKFLIGFFIILVLCGAYSVFKKLDNTQISSATISATAINSDLPDTRPQYFYVNNSQGVSPKVSAEAYVVGDLGTGEIILAKNEDKKLPIASLSKLMTALVAKEIVQETDTAKISKNVVSTYGGNGELKIGETIKVSDLIYPLLLESSNDAAEAIAEFFDRERFLERMNGAAKSLSLSNTSFSDPSGLSEKNQSTAVDLFKLAGYLSKEQPDLLDITLLKNYSNKKHNWSNISQFLKKDGYLGGKSGYIDEALQTVVSMFSLPLGEHVSRPVAITLLRSKDRAKDVDTILKYLKKNVYYGGLADANNDWILEKLAIPDIEEGFVDLAFMGDIMLDRGVKSSVVKNLGGSYSKLFEKPELTNVLGKADAVFANLEGTASDKGEDLGNLYSFHMDPATIPAIKSAGVSVLSVANNHVADFGVASYIDTLNRLRENEILYTGGGVNSGEAETPVVIERHGLKIGYLGFTDVEPNYMQAGQDKAGVLLASNPRFDEIVANASKQVDYLIVSFHFGEEYQKVHNARQESLAHRAIDNGAKIVVGHHPHVIEDTETYKNGYIMYSLGNFIFDQKFSTDTMQGLLVQIRLDKFGNMTVTKNTTKQNSFYQIGSVLKGKEEKIKLPESKIPIQ